MPGEGVEAGRLVEVGTVACEVGGSEIVGEDEEDVGTGSGGCLGESGCEEEDEETGGEGARRALLKTTLEGFEGTWEGAFF